MKSGDRYESPSGLGFVIRSATKKIITVEVERVVRKNGKQTVEKHLRDVPADLWELFSRPYKKV